MKIAVFGNYGVRNLGDDLILMGIQKKFEHHDLSVFCGNPDEVRTEFGLKSFPFFPGGVRTWVKYLFSRYYRREIRMSFEMLRQCDRIMIGGGGILVDRHFKAVILWWAQLRMIRRTGKPYEFLGNSLELKKFWSKILLLRFLKKAESVTVRDTASKAFLQSNGVKAELVDDLSQYAVLDISHRLPQKMMAISLCQWGLGPSQRSALQKFLEDRKREGYRLVGLAFQTIGDDDRKILEAVIPGIEIKTSLPDILEALRTSRVMLAMRYHAVLLGLRFSVPLVALSYQDKISNLMQDRNLSHLCIPIQNMDEQSLQEHFRKAVEAVEK
jgi:polysaccharide pyruvyl transferase WcaK-like protein